MRIATYNVNSINARLPSLLKWLQETATDVVCLQELKITNERFPCDAMVLAGDYNVIPTPRDVYRPERWTRDALFLPETREAYAHLLAQGWTDALRHLHPAETIYTFWDYFRNSFERDAGLRIDHLLLNASATDRLTAAGVDSYVRGWVRPSDHAPTWVSLAD